MISIKTVILTAIHYKGVEQAKKEVSYLANEMMCSEAYIKSIIKQVEKSQIIINGA